MIELIQIIINIFSLSTIAIIFGIYLIKKIPTVIGEASKQFLDLHLKKELAEFNSKLTTNIELLKIIKSNIEPQKIKAFIEFTNFYADMFSGIKVIKKDSPEVKRFNIGAAVNFFFFAEDKTIKEYQMMREYILSKSSVVGDKKVLEDFGTLIVQMRKDIGYKETKCNPDDFLSFIFNPPSS